MHRYIYIYTYTYICIYDTEYLLLFSTVNTLDSDAKIVFWHMLCTFQQVIARLLQLSVLHKSSVHLDSDVIALPLYMMFNTRVALSVHGGPKSPLNLATCTLPIKNWFTDARDQ